MIELKIPIAVSCVAMGQLGDGGEVALTRSIPPLYGEGGSRRRREPGGETGASFNAARINTITPSILANIGVRDADHVEAFASEHCIAEAVMGKLLGIVVAVAIGLDDQASRETGKVQIVAAKGNLSADVKALGAQTLELD